MDPEGTRILIDQRCSRLKVGVGRTVPSTTPPAHGQHAIDHHARTNHQPFPFSILLLRAATCISSATGRAR
eukprot:scaffold3704_cov95-Skeletonema_marinoi.AAC.4